MSTSIIKAGGRPTWRFMLSHPAHVLSLGLGSGLAWVMPGTFGTLMGWLLFVWINPHLTVLQWSVFIVFAFFLGVWACGRTGKALGVADHGSIVWDEIVAIWIVLLVAGGHFASPVQQLACVLVFRFFDMVKPPPIRWFDQRFKSGFGVMLDDVVAAFITLLALAMWVRYAS
ncbi:phosphatidylglycerophosphatase A [Limnobacter sp.]|uniref:phosphatidylglycerophosphatase A family protein n=1 Tax=Limnobacter sp. TaxID=2003368 RepID=UPI00351523C4